MLRPFLIIGVGGSGGKTIRGLRHALSLRLEQAGWDRGIPAAWQMIHYDTPIKQDGTDYVMPFIPAEQYRGLVASGASYEGVWESVVAQKIPQHSLNDVKRMLPDPSRVPIDVTKGAGQFRAVGRAAALSRLDQIAKAAEDSINRMQDATALGELESLGELLNARKEGGAAASPTVIVISSIAGGSGAGQYLDVIDAVKSTVRTQPWAHQFFALLYAPDVFDNIKGSAGIPSNALATVAETMNGFWTRDPSKATLEIYRSKGLSPSFGDARDRVGAAYPFIIGRRNSRVAFENQGDVYNAVSASISAWMTNDRVQGDIDEYATTNWVANTGPDKLPDATRLMRPLDQAPPFASLGFGRVTLGRDRFLDYASERFARSVIDRMLYAHIEEDPKFAERTESEWIEHRKDQVFEAFLRDSGLNEETEEKNDVIDRLRPPERNALAAEFLARIESDCSKGFDKTGGHDIDEWHHRMMTSQSAAIHGFVARDTAILNDRVNNWVESILPHLTDIVEKYVAAHGIPVAIELLRGLANSLRAATDELAVESDRHRGWANRLASYIHDELSVAANSESIRPDQDAVKNAFTRVEDSFNWTTEANLRKVASQLLRELREQTIEPLYRNLESTLSALRARVTDRVLEDGRENDYEQWPLRNLGATVPRKYKPAPNERLLVAHTDYAKEFELLVTNSFERRRYDEAVIDAITEIVAGPSDDEGIAEKDCWSTIEIRKGWRPSTTGDLDQKSARTELPRFAIETNPEIYQLRARRWMQRKGTPFDAYIQENLTDYFNSDLVEPFELKKRRDTYREGLLAALGTSEPLVRLNPGLLSEVHKKEIGEGTRLVVSAIPFAEGSELYEITKGVLTTSGVWDENISKGWFRDAKVDGIEIFAMAGFPFQPIVMDSIMEPIKKGWLADSTNPASRASFWKWKRARLLREAVPADPDVFDAILRGWYVAKSLELLTRNIDDEDRGPKLGVWDAEQKDYAFFPHPLLSAGAVSSRDYPGAIMESLIIALALCNAEGSLKPLRAYHVLLNLGGERTELSKALTDWIRSGQMPSGAPDPRVDRAGSPTGELSDRQAALRDYLDREKSEFIADVATQDTQSSVQSYPVSWEIRDTIIACLSELRDGVLETKPESSGI